MKLYWRLKKGGKWTWRSAIMHAAGDYTGKNGRRYLTVLAEEE